MRPRNKVKIYGKLGSPRLVISPRLSPESVFEKSRMAGGRLLLAFWPMKCFSNRKLITPLPPPSSSDGTPTVRGKNCPYVSPESFNKLSRQAEGINRWKPD